MKIISFSLWGNNPKYTVGAIRNAELAKDIYPDWTCVFHIGGNVPIEIYTKIHKVGNSLLALEAEPCDWTGMFWRFKDSYRENTEAVIFRDTDSRLNYREKEAVDVWLKSDKTFHIMRDHPYHQFPILGGMWGIKPNNKYPMKQLLDEFTKSNSYGIDYKFFAQKLMPLIKDDHVTHDPFFAKIPFPSERKDNEFVGDVFDEHDKRHPEFWKEIVKAEKKS